MTAVNCERGGMHAHSWRPYRPRDARLELVFTRPPVRHGDGFNLLPAIQAIFHQCAALRSCGIPTCTRAEMRIGRQDGRQSGDHLAASARVIAPSVFYALRCPRELALQGSLGRKRAGMP